MEACKWATRRIRDKVFECLSGHVCLAEACDCFRLAPIMRASDVEEVRLGWGMAPLDALLESYTASVAPFSIFAADGGILGMFGVADAGLPGVGVPWLLASDGLAGRRCAFLRHCRRFIGLMEEHYERLENHVYEENKLSQTWLRWCGFELSEPEPWGTAGALFRKAVKTIST